MPEALSKTRLAFPVFVRITACGIEIEPTGRAGNDRVEGESEITGIPAVPLRGTEVTTCVIVSVITRLLAQHDV
jgi:hypothetical protein